MNPFTGLKYIPNTKELLDVAFARAAKVSLPKSKKAPYIRAREKEIAKLNKVDDILATRLEEVVKRFPNFDNIDPFYRSLADTVVTIDDIRQALASVTSAVRIIKGIIRDANRNLRKAMTSAEARKLRSAAYGRISSVMRKIDARLITIRKAALEYRRFPSINLQLPVVVIAGFPNVGKSSLVTLMSTATPEVAEYPFTTKKISVGHIHFDTIEGQILDVPGLLDRPMKERNPIEQRAIAAIQYLADVIIFLIDPTLTCGYEITPQVGLLNEIRKSFPEVEIFPVINKMDIASPEEVQRAKNLIEEATVPIISALTEEGVDQILRGVIGKSTKVTEKLHLLQNQSP
ncbi:MAG: NOG1 family protein [Promethearchaeota archaeon]